VRTVYLGTSDFASTILRALADSPHRPALVVTRPDRPRGRGRRLAAPPVAETARQLGLELDQPASVNDAAARERIAAARPQLLIVCAFGALIRQGLLDAHEILNVHPSLLPRWRGAAPIERAIMAGDAQTGVAIMRLTAGLDSGPVWQVAREPIEARDTYGSLAARLADRGAELLLAALDTAARDGGLTYAEQVPDGVTYAEKITAEDRRLDPGRPAEALERTVRALAPHIGAAVPLTDGSRLGVWEAVAHPAAADDPPPGELRPGPDGMPRLGTDPGTLELREVQPPGGRPMAGDAWLRGHRR
jgi:methionyl-tRNA formyltransferase